MFVNIEPRIEIWIKILLESLIFVGKRIDVHAIHFVVWVEPPLLLLSIAKSLIIVIWILIQVALVRLEVM